MLGFFQAQALASWKAHVRVTVTPYTRCKAATCVRKRRLALTLPQLNSLIDLLIHDKHEIIN